MAFDVAVRILLMPVLLGQAFVIRRRVINLPEPDGARHGQVGAGPPLRLLIIGDSSAAGVGVDTQTDALLGQMTHALGAQFTVSYDLVAKTGARTTDVLRWLSDLPAKDYDVVVTALGVNDVTKATSARRFTRLQARLLEQLERQFSPRLVLVSGLPPMDQFPLLPQPMRWILGHQARRFDRILVQAVALRPQRHKIVIDMGLDTDNMARDGFHPGPSVYAAWADAAATLIATHLPSLDARPPGP